MDITNIKAFDYHPSISNMLIDHWRRTDTATMAAELSAILKQHPDRNAVRITHSFEAYQRSPKQYRKQHEERLELCASLGLKVIECLFNRWHDAWFDCGGTYLEQLVPDLSWKYKEGYYEPFLQDVCIDHKDDDRIVLWETCNKPFGVYRSEAEDLIMARYYEKRWLRELYCYIKKCAVPQPVGISFREDYDAETFKHLQKCCDVRILSSYYANPEKTAQLFEADFSGQPMPELTIPEY